MKKEYILIFIGLIIAFDLLLTGVIIKYVSYTEIDWTAYMQEVEGFLAGERDYKLIRGDTGPLVYPAGFLYIFSIFRNLTDNGTNVFKGQIIFACIYIANLMIVLYLYMISSKRVPWWSCIFLVLSKRIHSIYMLRMFNDCVAVLFSYVALACFTSYQWRVGCVFYSIAVSVKMNILLQAPGLLVILLMALGMQETIICLSICAAMQVVLGYPFLSTYPLSYIEKSFELGRVFMYKWTVNLKFLPEELFLSKELSVMLLVGTAFGMILLVRKLALQYQEDWNKNYHVTSKAAKLQNVKNRHLDHPRLSSTFIIYAIFTSNFIGVVFARTLHYQFYAWYYHTLPYLASYAMYGMLHRYKLSMVIKTMMMFIFTSCIMVMVEVAFNVYPATWWSSAMLQGAHLMLLVSICIASAPPIFATLDSKDEIVVVEKRKD